MDKNVKIFVSVIALLILGVIATVLLRGPASSVQTSGEYDAFAQCLKDEGAVFYGAFWCPHCQNQKKMFGSSQKLLPYEECSTADGKAMLPVCMEKGIKSYPTWIFKDGSQLSGEIPLETLAEKTGCSITTPEASTEEV